MFLWKLFAVAMDTQSAGSKINDLCKSNTCECISTGSIGKECENVIFEGLLSRKIILPIHILEPLLLVWKFTQNNPRDSSKMCGQKLFWALIFNVPPAA